MRPKLIFICLVRIDSLDERGIYQDLLREFLLNGYDVTVICPLERKTGLGTRILTSPNTTILQVRTLNIQKCNIVEKGFSIISLNFLFKKALRKYIDNLSFDLILYTTPPITLVDLISWLKTINKAKTYLLLKDIFPQNAVDMGYLKFGGLIHRYFANTEKELYQISDRIGCISKANVDYLIKYFPNVISKIEVNPNSIDLTRIPKLVENRKEIRMKLGIPFDSIVFLFGGNLGKPQGTEYLLELINNCVELVPRAYFLIIGDGTDFSKLSNWFRFKNPINAQLIKKLSKNEFDSLAGSCDVGLVLLRKEFTIPNFPSRLLTYLESKLPILAITDTVSDVGKTAVDNNFGKWSEYGDLDTALGNIIFFANEAELRRLMGHNGFQFMQANYSTTLSFKLINDFLGSEK